MHKGEEHVSAKVKVEANSLVEPFQGILWCGWDEQKVGSLTTGDGSDKSALVKDVTLGDVGQGVVALVE